ncbi:hypothetical protein CR513_16085, partial [Mucuna pruriens]
MAHCQQVGEVEIGGKYWYHDIKEYLEEGAYPLGETKNDKRTLRGLATSFFLSGTRRSQIDSVSNSGKTILTTFAKRLSIAIPRIYTIATSSVGKEY